jgi:hypothetical protein
MATSAAAGYVPNVHHPDVMRAILEGVVETGEVPGTPGPGRTTLAVTLDDWLSDEPAVFGADVEDREPEEGI